MRSDFTGPPAPSGWREPMVWLVVAGPAAVVLAGVVTAAIAWRGSDALLESPAAQLRVAEPAQRPALQARNHAAAPR
jgi:hypothetical protein